MGKKTYFLIADTETTQDSLVADFGAVVCDRKGKIVNQCAILVNGVYTDFENHPLFFTSDPDGIWSQAGQDRRYVTYTNMLKSGSRMLASIPAINKWLAKCNILYNPILTAYNLPFDIGKCQNTGIDLSIFERRFCLWSASVTQWAHTRAYRNLVLQLHAFNSPTELKNMTFKTNAETMARYALGHPTLQDEPHTALEDVIYYELPILRKLCKARSVKWLLYDTDPYNWRNVQVKDWYKPS
jgi:hypothetical protein